MRPREMLARTQRQIAVDLVAEIRRPDRRISAAGDAITAAVAAAGSTPTRLYGVGDIVAAIVLARTGSVSRFASSAHFASFAGVAPIEVSSGDVVRPTSANDMPGRATETLRRLKRRLADVVYRTLLHDANTSFGTPS
ncbi:transposase [Micromonospora sp. HB375]|uniref:transposase n=1 Tax=unclassified Micromonospora TaxID=2617518 RepID=UPI001AE586DE|nr:MULTISPECIES: transposase [unclassified Micromonospora]MBP1782074.1 transposase [Micromonospora sp. HB375]MDH6470850.1 transposase [Micromonospora sp. H404/HB375]